MNVGDAGCAWAEWVTVRVRNACGGANEGAGKGKPTLRDAYVNVKAIEYSRK